MSNCANDSGDISRVIASGGLSGGGTQGDISISISCPDCTTRWSTRFITDCADQHYELCTSAGWVQTSPSVFTCACLVADTRITMADGSRKAIAEIRAGDRVRSSDASSNTVLGAVSHPIGSGRIFSINGQVEATGDHPFLDADGVWRVADVAHFNANPHGIRVDDSPLAPRQTLITEWGRVSVDKVAVVTARDPNELVSDLVLTGDRTYIANGYVVSSELVYDEADPADRAPTRPLNLPPMAAAA